MEEKRATARRTRGQEGKTHRQNENIILNETEHTHTYTQFFSEYRLVWFSLSLVLIILSLYVCMYTCRSIHHAHRHTHVLGLLRRVFVLVDRQEFLGKQLFSVGL